ncbi:hypothetical protein BDQ17DRAFT_1425626 [Cyathus striatus]|nr:hypothetical protein BDQ17DRAFT_1425626 [Cyathus striatus]
MEVKENDYSHDDFSDHTSMMRILPIHNKENVNVDSDNDLPDLQDVSDSEDEEDDDVMPVTSLGYYVDVLSTMVTESKPCSQHDNSVTQNVINIMIEDSLSFNAQSLEYEYNNVDIELESSELDEFDATRATTIVHPLSMIRKNPPKTIIQHVTLKTTKGVIDHPKILHSEKQCLTMFTKVGKIKA